MTSNKGPRTVPNWPDYLQEKPRTANKKPAQLCASARAADPKHIAANRVIDPMTAQYCAPYAAHGALNWLIRAMTLVIDKERQ